jgi:hypothetical protein
MTGDVQKGVASILWPLWLWQHCMAFRTRFALCCGAYGVSAKARQNLMMLGFLRSYR